MKDVSTECFPFFFLVCLKSPLCIAHNAFKNIFWKITNRRETSRAEWYILVKMRLVSRCKLYFPVVTTSFFGGLKTGGLTEMSAQCILGGSDYLSYQRFVIKLDA